MYFEGEWHEPWRCYETSTICVRALILLVRRVRSVFRACMLWIPPVLQVCRYSILHILAVLVVEIPLIHPVYSECDISGGHLCDSSPSHHIPFGYSYVRVFVRLDNSSCIFLLISNCFTYCNKLRIPHRTTLCPLLCALLLCDII